MIHECRTSCRYLIFQIRSLENITSLVTSRSKNDAKATLTGNNSAKIFRQRVSVMETQGQPDLFLDHLDFSSILIRWSEKTMINCSMRVFKYEVEIMNDREDTIVKYHSYL